MVVPLDHPGLAPVSGIRHVSQIAARLPQPICRPTRYVARLSAFAGASQRRGATAFCFVARRHRGRGLSSVGFFSPAGMVSGPGAAAIIQGD